MVSSPGKPRVTSARARTAVDVSGSHAAITVVATNSHRPAPRVLVFDLDSARGLSLAASLRRLPHEIVVSVTNARGTGADGAGEQLDVALVSFADARFDGLAFGAELGATFPWIEIVYWFEEGGAAPLAAAARSVGVRRIIPLTRLFGWLDGALPSLARMARARHEHLSAERMLPPLPSPEDGIDDSAPPLPQAERLFREAYLRQLLSRSGNRTIAARRAGVPYTTFCSMLKKLGLE